MKIEGKDRPAKVEWGEKSRKSNKPDPALEEWMALNGLIKVADDSPTTTWIPYRLPEGKDYQEDSIFPPEAGDTDLVDPESPSDSDAPRLSEVASPRHVSNA